MYKILVIGNGFDIACGMPTKYTEFLDFVKYIYPGKEYIGYDGLTTPDVDSKIKEMADDLAKYSLEELMQKVKEIVKHNVWINHFLAVEKNLPEGSKWMDFEEEIRHVIKVLDSHKQDDFQQDSMARENEKKIKVYPDELKGYNWFYFFAKDDYKSEIEKLLRDECISNPDEEPAIVLSRLIYKNHKNGILAASLCAIQDGIQKRKTYDEIRKGLLSDLEDLKFVLKVYLYYFAPLVKKGWDEIATPVKNCIEWFCDESSPADTKHLLLNFNYTETLHSIVQAAGLKVPENMEICHIHGKAEQDGNGNIVIGIDDSSDKEDIFWGEFEKYYQKIKNGVDGSFYEFVNSAEYAWPGHEVRIIGHSLALTDRHPLEKIFNIPEATVKCYYYKDCSETIRKATAIVGKDQILLRALGSPQRISFINSDDT